ACGHDVRVDRSRLPLQPAVAIACEVLGVDPYWSLSEGTLIACVAPEHAVNVIKELAEEQIAAADVGEIMSGHGKLWVAEPDGRVSTFDAPQPDPYWPAYDRALREGWK
ncbi:MAG: AIR synthase-related protein, partial [Candidatus Eisenbacteria bacterium]